MKKRFLITIILLIFILIFYFFINTYNNKLLKEKHVYPICGDDICESSEESYCLDCNLSCKSKFCNSKINIICNNCSVAEKELFPVFFEHQIVAYDCLADYYGYHPLRIVYHTISNVETLNQTCGNEEGCYIGGGGFSEREGVKQDFITRLIENNDKEVTKKENVGLEIHELSHAFTYYSLGSVPSWFTEGISIYSESKLSCHPNQYTSSDEIEDFISLYRDQMDNITLLYDEYEKTKSSSHVIGALYFGILERDYGCDKGCIAKILYSLYEYRENCIGDCFENAKRSITSINLSLNNNDLRIQIITNKIIKQKSEEISKEDLTELFDMLIINY